MSAPRAVVIGVGNEFRRDDGIGPVVAVQLERMRLPGVAVELCDGEPTGLLDLWAGAELAVVVDAVLCEPATPGRIWRTTVDALRGLTHAASSHALGIPDALPLGRLLGRVPAELVVIAVEAEHLELGVGLSDPVTAAVPDVLAAVLAELARIGIASGPRPDVAAMPALTPPPANSEPPGGGGGVSPGRFTARQHPARRRNPDAP